MASDDVAVFHEDIARAEEQVEANRRQAMMQAQLDRLISNLEENVKEVERQFTAICRGCSLPIAAHTWEQVRALFNTLEAAGASFPDVIHLGADVRPLDDGRDLIRSICGA